MFILPLGAKCACGLIKSRQTWDLSFGFSRLACVFSSPAPSFPFVRASSPYPVMTCSAVWCRQCLCRVLSALSLFSDFLELCMSECMCVCVCAHTHLCACVSRVPSAHRGAVPALCFDCGHGMGCAEGLGCGGGYELLLSASS